MKFKFMINCQEAARLLSDKLEYSLPLHKRLLLRMHVTMCSACCYYGKQIKALKDLLARHLESNEGHSSPSESSLSDDACERMKSLLKKKNL